MDNAGKTEKTRYQVRFFDKSCGPRDCGLVVAETDNLQIAHEKAREWDCVNGAFGYTLVQKCKSRRC